MADSEQVGDAMTDFTVLMRLREQMLRTRVMHLEDAIGSYLVDGDRARLETAYSNEWVKPMERTVNAFEIVESTGWFGRRSRKLVGEPSWEALAAWRAEGDVAAPSLLWLRDAVGDALDEIERRGGVA